MLVQRLLLCTRVTEDALRFAFRRRDLTGAEQVHGDTSVEIVQLGEFQCPCFLGRNVRLNKLTIRGVGCRILCQTDDIQDGVNAGETVRRVAGRRDCAAPF